MHWTVVAPFFKNNGIGNAVWLDDFVPAGQHSFTKIFQAGNRSSRNWHARLSRNTQIPEWHDFWRQSGDAWRGTRGGCITVFPQLAAMVGLRKMLSKRRVPVVAWCFNVGMLYPGVKKILARSILENIDKFIVHSKRERDSVSSWLNIDKSRFEFIPLQRGRIQITEEEDHDDPFILSMGSANRDFKTLFLAVEKLGIKTVVVTKKSVVKNLDIPKNVKILTELTINECRCLSQKAVINVVPLIDSPTAAGQVTIVEAMRMNRAVIATRCVGSEDYICHDKTGLLVEPYSVDDLTTAINQLWLDSNKRQIISVTAGEYAQNHFSDEVVGRELGRILNQFQRSN